MAYSTTIPIKTGHWTFCSRRMTDVPNYDIGFFYGAVRDSAKAGSRVEGFKTLIAERKDANSDYSFTRYETKSTPASVSIDATHRNDPNLKGSWVYTGCPGYNQSFLVTASPNENLALARLYAKIRQTRSEMNGLAFLGELRETLTMIRRPGTAIASGLAAWANKTRDIYNRNPALQGRRNRNRFAAVVHDSYLETVFGLRPALSDAASLAEAMARLSTDNADRVTRVKVKVDSQAATVCENFITADPAWGSSMSPAPYVSIWDRRTGSSATVRWDAFLSTQLVSSVPEDTFTRVARVTGVTLENVVPAAYELFPYSFLADYFSNLGKVIECTFTDTTAYLFGSKTVYVEDFVHVLSKHDHSVLYASYDAQGWLIKRIVTSDGSAREVRKSLTRTKQPVLPLPKLEFFLPNSPWKYGNIAALALAKLNRVAA